VNYDCTYEGCYDSELGYRPSHCSLGPRQALRCSATRRRIEHTERHSNVSQVKVNTALVLYALYVQSSACMSSYIYRGTPRVPTPVPSRYLAACRSGRRESVVRSDWWPFPMTAAALHTQGQPLVSLAMLFSGSEKPPESRPIDRSMECTIGLIRHALCYSDRMVPSIILRVRNDVAYHELRVWGGESSQESSKPCASAV
jgi:hypothetical protein